jgi:hypothetical protein
MVVTFTNYSTGSRIVEKFDDFGAAIRCAHLLTKVIQDCTDWDRHDSVDGPQSHCGTYFDLYNQGSIVIK